VERWKCDRNGGVFRRYMQRKMWSCPSCGDSKQWAGHRCQYCRRRVCCECFHHDEACCLVSASDTDVSDAPPKLVAPCPHAHGEMRR
jgi:hypothetical protein